MPWWRRRVPVARAALMPVLVSSVLSLTGPLAEGRWLLATALAGRIGAEVLVLALVWGRRQAPHVVAVAFLGLVLLTALLNRHYDVWLILVSGSALLLTGVAVVVDRVWQP